MKQGGGGWDFAGGYNVKGCYAYEDGTFAGIAFYGIGGTKEEMKITSLESPKYRPPGYDCFQEGKF